MALVKVFLGLTDTLFTALDRQHIRGIYIHLVLTTDWMYLFYASFALGQAMHFTDTPYSRPELGCAPAGTSLLARRKQIH